MSNNHLLSMLRRGRAASSGGGGGGESGTIYAEWVNTNGVGVFSGGGSATFPLDGGVRIARFDLSGVNTGQNRMYYPVPSSYMTGGKVLHLAWEVRMPQSTLDVLATNLGSAPYTQIKLHLSRAENDAPKWAGQAYRFAMAGLGVSSNAGKPNACVVLNDWFNQLFSPHKESSDFVADTWKKIQLAYRDDGSNAYVRTWYGGVEVGSESVSNDSVLLGGSNNNGGSEGQSLTYNMSFGIEYAQLPGAQTNALRVEIRRIVISDYFLTGF